jgi:DedD protein
MATRSEASEPAVDELKRRARRRLVGAVVLALAAAVLLPLLLESEPKPLGDDVSIQIPPVDSGKFINPLSSAKAPDPKVKGSTAGGKSAAELAPPSPSGDAPPGAAPGPKPGAAASEAPVASAPVAVPAMPPSPAADATAGTAEQGQAGVAVKPGTLATAEAQGTPQATARADGAGAPAAYVVQIAAFSDRYGANSLATKLKHDGFPGYTEVVTTGKGTTLHRVRVGPYASREAADAALVKLKAAGFSGMVTHVG